MKTNYFSTIYLNDTLTINDDKIPYVVHAKHGIKNEFIIEARQITEPLKKITIRVKHYDKIKNIKKDLHPTQ
jgi:hypothetical protein